MEKIKTAIHCDGLGNPIVLGKRYGYAKNDSGWTHAVIGIAEKLTEKGVTIKVESANRAMHNDDTEKLTVNTSKEYEWRTIKAKINIKGMCLFPVDLT